MNPTAEDRLRQLAERCPALEPLRDRWPGIAAGERIRACVEALAGAVSADGCTYYSLQGSELVFDVVLSRSLGLGGGYQSGSVDFPSIRMSRLDGSVDDSSLAVRAAHTEQTLHVADVAAELGSEAARTMGFDRVMGYDTHSILTVPVIPDGDDVCGVIQLVNATDADGAVTAFNPQQIAIAEEVAELIAEL